MADTVTAKILKYDPSVDAAPHYETYEVEWREFITGLEVLHYINDNVEPVAFDYCCRSGLCGRCSMTIDGKPVLACATVLEPGEHTFEPLATFPVIRDLVTDQDGALRKMIDTKLAVQSPKKYKPITVDYELYWETLERINMCRECMCCYSTCSALLLGNPNEYAGPGAMAQIALRYLDEADVSDRLGQAVYSGLFNCIECGNCDLACPSGIPHVELFVKMKADAEAAGLKPEE